MNPDGLNEFKLKKITCLRDEGWIGPVMLFRGEDCRTLLSKLSQCNNPPPRDWSKGHAASNRLFFDVAAHPQVGVYLDLFIGRDIMLWGACILRWPQKEQIPWHYDREICVPGSCSISLIIALGPDDAATVCRFIPRSHNHGVTARQFLYTKGKSGVSSDDSVRTETHNSCDNVDVREVVLPAGSALFLDSTIWRIVFSSEINQETNALLLQYATPDTIVRIPFCGPTNSCSSMHEVPQPPCVLIQGNGRKSKNRIVPPPPRPGFSRPSLTSLVRQLEVPLNCEADTERTSYPIFHGSTSCLGYFGVYASVLRSGGCPHRPHSHNDEEILIVLNGEANIIIADSPEDISPRTQRLWPGCFVYYPSGQHHTIQNISGTPLSYLMIKWRSDAPTDVDQIGMQVILYEPVEQVVQSSGLHKKVLLEGFTRNLGKLQVHMSSMRSGTRYAAHADSYDVAIVVLDGAVESLGKTVGPNGVILYASGESHGMTNKSDTSAKYLVFEFHSPHRKASCFDLCCHEIR